MYEADIKILDKAKAVLDPPFDSTILNMFRFQVWFHIAAILGQQNMLVKQGPMITPKPYATAMFLNVAKEVAKDIDVSVLAKRESFCNHAFIVLIRYGKHLIEAMGIILGDIQFASDVCGEFMEKGLQFEHMKKAFGEGLEGASVPSKEWPAILREHGWGESFVIDETVDKPDVKSTKIVDLLAAYDVKYPNGKTALNICDGPPYQYICHGLLSKYSKKPQTGKESVFAQNQTVTIVRTFDQCRRDCVRKEEAQNSISTAGLKLLISALNLRFAWVDIGSWTVNGNIRCNCKLQNCKCNCECNCN